MLQELVAPSVDFYFRSGQVAKSVSDLLLILIDMGDEEFLDHLHKSEFTAWADRLVHNSELTQKVKVVQSKRELIQLLKEKVQYHSVLNQESKTSGISLMPKSGAYTQVDFDVDSGQVVRVPSKQKEIEAWEKQFFESTEKGLIPKAFMKEFLYGASAGFFLGLVLGGVLYRVR
ncbi:MAG: hypothetical protein AABX70_05430 [Nanoarchaeota archaeon]